MYIYILYIYIFICEPPGTHKKATYSRYTKRKWNLSITLQKVTKAKEKKAREEERNIDIVQNIQKIVNKMAISVYVSIITLSVNGQKSSKSSNG